VREPDRAQTSDVLRIRAPGRGRFHVPRYPGNICVSARIQCSRRRVEVLNLLCDLLASIITEGRRGVRLASVAKVGGSFAPITLPDAVSWRPQEDVSLPGKADWATHFYPQGMLCERREESEALVLIQMFSHDDLEHRLVAHPPLRCLRAKLLYKVFIQKDRSRL